MRMRAKIQKWGNDLGLRLSGPMESIPQFKENMIVVVEVTREGIQVSPMKKDKVKQLPFTEAQLLKGLDFETSHSQELASVSSEEFEN